MTEGDNLLFHHKIPLVMLNLSNNVVKQEIISLGDGEPQ
jgi:hypothetical protein